MEYNFPDTILEADRVQNLADFDLDYTSLESTFSDLITLASRIAGTQIALLNLVDSFTQWSVANYGLPVQQLPRKDSICQYTIAEQDYLEVPDLATDARFKDLAYVKEAPYMRFYLGIPLKTEEGYNIGTLCVLDTQATAMSPNNIELLQIIAREIVNRLHAIKTIHLLGNQVSAVKKVQKRVVHDIRGPLEGIKNIAQIVIREENQKTKAEVLQVLNMIQHSSQTMLELADDILANGPDSELNPELVNSEKLTLILLKDKLEKLYQPQALHKQIDFTVNINPETALIRFSKNKLLQITGNIISNALKFTPAQGKVTVNLNLVVGERTNALHLTFTDSGVGLNKENIEAILNHKLVSTRGTGGEQGYGFGLPLVAHLVKCLNGTLELNSQPGIGTTFQVILPQAQENAPETKTGYSSDRAKSEPAAN